MAQARSPKFSTSGSSFLTLPSTIRRRIYILAGLIRFCPIDLNHESRRKDRYFRTCVSHLRQMICGWDGDMERGQLLMSQQDAVALFSCFYRQKRFEDQAIFPGPDGIDCVCGPLPIRLLLVSRAIYTEAMATLYSENQFKICRTAPGGLTALLRLGPDTLQTMTRLHVRLNACGCIPSHVCSVEGRPEGDPFYPNCPSCHYSCKCGPELPLSSQDPEARTVVLEWQHLVRHLGHHLKPYQLRLSVVCDTLDRSMAHQILAPIQELPLLASCAIRLGQLPDSYLRLLAETATRKATGQPCISSTSFAWDDLPYELQLRVLSHSDLVAPDPLEWIEGDGLPRPTCCQQCTDCLETCCCPGLHAGFSSLGCRCWQWPHNLFLVNKVFRQQAISIAYGWNTFSLCTTHDRNERGGESQYKHRSVLRFLRSIPRDALPHIRSLRIVFRSFMDDDLCTGTQSLSNWTATLVFMQQHLSLFQLHLTVCTLCAIEDESDWIDAENLEWAFYQRMAAPMAVVRGLQHLQLPFPPPRDSARVARNLLRETQLQRQILGLLGGEFDTKTLPKGQGHPEFDKPRDRNVVKGPSGERIWPIPSWQELMT